MVSRVKELEAECKIMRDGFAEAVAMEVGLEVERYKTQMAGRIEMSEADRKTLSRADYDDWLWLYERLGDARHAKFWKALFDDLRTRWE